MFLASSAPAWDLKWRTAARNPASSDFSGDNTSASVNSLDHTTIDRSASSVVFNGKRRIKMEHGPDVNDAPPFDCGALCDEVSTAKAFIVAIDKD